MHIFPQGKTHAACLTMEPKKDFFPQKQGKFEQN
jgi:hypothetical protein